MAAEFIKLYEDNTDQKIVRHVVEVLKKGGLVIFPTDSVYSLGCDIMNKKAVERVAQIKGAKVEKAKLSFICSDFKQVSDHIAQIETSTFKILKRSLPGAYTFLLPHSNFLPNVFRKKKTVGIRIPDNAIIQQITEMLGNPVISTSIKKDDDILEYPTNPELIWEEWQHQVDIVIDGGMGGIEPTTVIDLTTGDPVLVREGKGSLKV